VTQLIFPKGLIVPINHSIYVLYIDDGRRFYMLKQRLLKGVLTIAEGLSN